ncbi:MAG: NfeD family protein [Deltaproteobacteria bacterium]|nr:NfeD family protein [Deltaproteobacteria bacterium]
MDLLAAYFIWFLIGFAFIVAELTVLPAFILIFFALGAWLTAGLVFFQPLSLTWQIIVFMVSSLVLLALLRRWGIRVFRGRVDDPAADGLADPAAGQRAEVTQAIAPPLPGLIKYRGSFWPARAATEIPVGRSVVILGQEPGDHTTYLVKPAEKA